MIMRIKILSIALTVSVSSLCFLKYAQYRNKSNPTKLPKTVESGNNIDNLNQPTSEPEIETNLRVSPTVIDRELTLKEIIQQGHGNDAYRASVAMEEFLKNWNPIGHTTEELMEIFGEPYEKKINSVIYSFDNGEFGWNFEFIFENDKITEVRRPPSE